MSGFGVWIIAIWILLFATLDVALSNYSEDQCSWMGRQVFLLLSVRVDQTGHSEMRAATGVGSFFHASWDNACVNATC